MEDRLINFENKYISIAEGRIDPLISKYNAANPTIQKNSRTTGDKAKVKNVINVLKYIRLIMFNIIIWRLEGHFKSPATKQP